MHIIRCGECIRMWDVKVRIVTRNTEHLFGIVAQLLIFNPILRYPCLPPVDQVDFPLVLVIAHEHSLF